MSNNRELADLISQAGGTSESVLAGRRNLIINGGFDVWQRGTSFNYTNYYSADRWGRHQYQHATRSQVACSLSGSVYAMRASGDASTNMRMSVAQGVESIDAKKLRGKTVTLSFYIRFSASSLSGGDTFRAFVGSTSATTDATFASTDYIADGYSFVSFEQGSLPATFTKYTVTYDVPFTANNLAVIFQFANQAVFSTSEWYEIAQVQLELGSVATPFEHRSYGEELALCQRYYQDIDLGSNGFLIGGRGASTSGTPYYEKSISPSMRAAPSLTIENATNSIVIRKTTPTFINFYEDGRTVNANSCTNIYGTHLHIILDAEL